MPRRHEIQPARSTAGRERSPITDQRNPLYNRPFNREQILTAKVSKTLTLQTSFIISSRSELFIIPTISRTCTKWLSTAPDPPLNI